MKAILTGALLVLFGSNNPALAQGHDFSAWLISDIRTATITEVDGKVPSKPGPILEVRAKFEYLPASVSGVAALSGDVSMLEIPGVRLSGISEGSDKAWSNVPIAVGFDSPAGCVSYRLLDSKGKVSSRHSIGGLTVEMDIKDGKLKMTSGVLMPLCLAFPVPDPARNLTLSFSGTDVRFEGNTPGSQPIVEQSVTVDEKVMPYKLVKHPSPVYPPLAKLARIEGTVVLSVTIAADGNVKDVQVFKTSNPLLLYGIADVVKMWAYQPTLLGGVPVEVRTRVTVNFQLP